MATKTRSELKLYFVKNAIPTQGNFADLVDSQLNQSDDGVFKQAGDPLSVVAGSGEQKRALRLYSDYPAPNPDWLISLNPQNPDDSQSTAPGFGIANGAGETRLFLDAEGNLRTTGSVTAGGISVKGTVPHIEADGSFYRHTDGQVYITVDDNLYIRDKNATDDNPWASWFNTNTGDLHLKGTLHLGNKKVIPQESWHTAALLGGAVSYGGYWEPAGFFKDSCGIVHLRGLVKSPPRGTPSGDNPLFELPVGYRPQHRQVNIVGSTTLLHSTTEANIIQNRIDIWPDGKVLLTVYNGGVVSLCAISFRAA